jgi:outer membrane biogenesis lipoprotein LolB
MRRPLPLLLLLLLPACAVVAPAPPKEETPIEAVQRREQAPKPQYNLTGYPPALRDGYIDGCETAKQSSYGRRNEKRMATEAQYKLGWNDGFSICGKK